MILNDGKLGFLESESEPTTFLSVDNIYTQSLATDIGNYHEYTIKMGDNKSIYKREAYTILSLLGDFGGFTDALALIIGLFVSFYSAKMFTAAIAQELPYSDRSKQSSSFK